MFNFGWIEGCFMESNGDGILDGDVQYLRTMLHGNGISHSIISYLFKILYLDILKNCQKHISQSWSPLYHGQN